MAKPRKVVAPAAPRFERSHLAEFHAAGFETVAWLNNYVTTGEDRREYLPRLSIRLQPGKSGERPRFDVIEWLPSGHPANGYAGAGWFPQSHRNHGGLYHTPCAALDWFAWLARQEAGR